MEGSIRCRRSAAAQPQALARGPKTAERVHRIDVAPGDPEREVQGRATGMAPGDTQRCARTNPGALARPGRSQVRVRSTNPRTVVDAHRSAAGHHTDEDNGPTGGGSHCRSLGNPEVDPPMPRVEPDRGEPTDDGSLDGVAHSLASRDRDMRHDHREHDSEGHRLSLLRRRADTVPRGCDEEKGCPRSELNRGLPATLSVAAGPGFALTGRCGGRPGARPLRRRFRAGGGCGPRGYDRLWRRTPP